MPVLWAELQRERFLWDSRAIPAHARTHLGHPLWMLPAWGPVLPRLGMGHRATRAAALCVSAPMFLRSMAVSVHSR